MAGFVGQQRIDPNGAFASKVLEDHLIRQGNQQAVIALTTLDTRLFANTGQPLIATGRCIARVAGGFAFPADRVDVGAATKQPTKERYFFSSRKTR